MMVAGRIHRQPSLRSQPDSVTGTRIDQGLALHADGLLKQTFNQGLALHADGLLKRTFNLPRGAARSLRGRSSKRGTVAVSPTGVGESCKRSG
jgi:hypothetical protein